MHHKLTYPMKLRQRVNASRTHTYSARRGAQRGARRGGSHTGDGTGAQHFGKARDRVPESRDARHPHVIGASTQRVP